MGDVLRASVQFPTVLFSALLLIALVMWILPLLGAEIGGAGDGVDSATDGAGDGVLDSLGITGVPLTIVLTIVGLIGWGVSVLGQLFLVDPLSGGVAFVAGAGILVFALAVSWFVTRAVGPSMSRRLEPTLAPSAADLVGRTVEVRSHSVGPDHGYGDARTADGSSVRIDIRTRPDHAADPEKSRSFGNGDTVLIIDYDNDHHSYIVDQLPSWL